MSKISTKYHTVIIGGGHNGLVAASYLAKAGKKVLLLEKNSELGGATASRQSFPDYEAWLSTYSYLVSLFPRQIMQELGLNINLMRRRIASYTPYWQEQAPKGLLLSHSDERISLKSILELGNGEAEWQGYRQFLRQQNLFAELVWDSFLTPLHSKSEFERRFRQAGQSELWQNLVEEPLGHFIEKSVQSDLLRGVLLTDAKIGAFTHAHDESLLQNRTFLYHIIGNKTGEWRVPEGGMGHLVEQLVRKASRGSNKLVCKATLRDIHAGYPHHTVHFELDGNSYEVQTQYLLSNASERILHTLLGRPPAVLTDQDEGTAFKINMLLRKLPVLKDPDVHQADAFAGTFHINQTYSQLEKTFAGASAGQLPETLAGEIYCHTLTDPSILSKDLQEMGYHTLTYFGLDLPHRLFTADNEKAKQEIVRRFLVGINAYLDEPLEDCLAHDAQGNLCLEAKSALDLERELGLPLGNIFHKPLSWFFAEHKAETGTWGVETPWERVFVCGSSARRGGAVSGIPGRNAAMAVLGQ